MPYKQPPKNRQFGQPEGNPQGTRKKGDLGKKTIWEMAMKEVAQALKMGKEPERPKVELVKTGWKEAFKGNYQFWLKVMQELKLITEEEKLRIEGKIKTEIEQTLPSEEDREIAKEVDKALKNYVRKKQKFTSLGINK